LGNLLRRILVAEGLLRYVAYSRFRSSHGCMSHWHVFLGPRVADLRRMQCCQCLCPARGIVSDRYSAHPTDMDSPPTASCRRHPVAERAPRSRMGAVANRPPPRPPPALACQLAPTIPFHRQETCQQWYGIIGAHCHPERGERRTTDTAGTNHNCIVAMSGSPPLLPYAAFSSAWIERVTLFWWLSTFASEDIMHTDQQRPHAWSNDEVE